MKGCGARVASMKPPAPPTSTPFSCCVQQFCGLLLNLRCCNPVGSRHSSSTAARQTDQQLRCGCCPHATLRCCSFASWRRTPMQCAASWHRQLPPHQPHQQTPQHSRWSSQRRCLRRTTTPASSRSVSCCLVAQCMRCVCRALHLIGVSVAHCISCISVSIWRGSADNHTATDAWRVVLHCSCNYAPSCWT